MNKIVLIVPYFGRFNNYFPFWLKSAGNNRIIDFLIVTDNVKPDNLNENIKWINEDFGILVDKIKGIVPELSGNLVLNSPYKLCDYRPLYGRLFQDYIVSYEFWGYCDVDLIFGDFSAFISDEMLKRYDKFYCRGHLTIYRNNDFFRNFYLLDDARMRVTFREAWRTNHCCHFDELHTWDSVIEDYGYRCYKEVDFADTNIKSKRFQLAMGNDGVTARQIYAKEGKKLFQYYLNEGEVKKKEILYVHLQKRKIGVETKNRDCFLIIPNQFTDIRPITSELIEEHSPEVRYWKEYYVRRFHEIINNIKNGALKVRFWVFIRKVKNKYVK